MKLVKSTDVLVVMGDWNTKVGKEETGHITAKFGLGDRNLRGERLIQFCQEENLIVTNTFYQHHKRRLYTWMSPGDQHRNQIDFILVKNRFKNHVKDVRTYPGADVMSDHNLLVTKLKLKLKLPEKSQRQDSYEVNLLKQVEYREQFAIEVRNRFDALMIEELEQYEKEEDKINQQWDSFKASIIAAQDKVLPKKKRKEDKMWMTEDILEMMKERREKKGTSEYKQIDKTIKKRCKERKEEWYNSLCKEVEDLEKSHKMREMHKKVKEITDRKRGIKTSSGCIKDRNGRVLFDKKEVAKRWVEYIKELYEDENRSDSLNSQVGEGLELLKEEIMLAIKDIKTGKAAGTDSVMIEHLKALDDTTINIVVKICQEVYKSGFMPHDLTHAIFIKLPKKKNTMECSEHRTISLISHVTKVILKVILRRNEKAIDQEIEETQSGFSSGVGTREGILNLRLIFDKYLEVKQNVFVCYIDYEKAFDRVYQDQLMSKLKSCDIHAMDLRMIQNLYWNQTASIKLEEGESDSFAIKRGVRQGCILSPKLFNLYTEDIFKQADKLPGVNIGGKNITNLRYADDTALIAESAQGLQLIVDVVKSESLKRGLKMNIKKTKTMVISRDPENPKVDINVDGNTLEQVEIFKYLGQTITSDGRSDTAIRQRIEIVRQTFLNMSDVLTARNIEIETRKRLARCYVLSTLLYASETWTLNADTCKKINSFEMWMYRKMLKISYTSHTTNEEVLKRIHEKGLSLEKNIKMRKTQYFGHLIRKDKMQKSLLEGRVCAKRPRGRPRKSWMKNIMEWTKLNFEQCIRGAEDRDYWRGVTTNLLN